jgi:hypothetical protein
MRIHAYLHELAYSFGVQLAVAHHELAVWPMERDDAHVAAGVRLAQRVRVCTHAALGHDEVVW